MNTPTSFLCLIFLTFFTCQEDGFWGNDVYFSSDQDWKSDNSGEKLGKLFWAWTDLKMQRKLQAVSAFNVTFKIYQIYAKIQFEMKNQSSFSTYFRYILPKLPQTLFPSEMSVRQGMGYFCAARNSIPTKPHFSIPTLFHPFFLSRTNLITTFRLTASVSIVVIIVIASRTASSVSACSAKNFWYLF